MQDTTHQPHGIEQFRSKLVNITSTQLIKHKRIIHFWWVVLIGFHDIHIWVFEGRSVKKPYVVILSGTGRCLPVHGGQESSLTARPVMIAHLL